MVINTLERQSTLDDGACYQDSIAMVNQSDSQHFTDFLLANITQKKKNFTTTKYCVYDNWTLASQITIEYCVIRQVLP